MIPTIEDILADLLAGHITKEQAIDWLYAHCDSVGMRDTFAAAALPAIMKASDIQEQLAWGPWAASVARTSYEVADAMLKERSK